MQSSVWYIIETNIRFHVCDCQLFLPRNFLKKKEKKINDD